MSCDRLWFVLLNVVERIQVPTPTLVEIRALFPRTTDFCFDCLKLRGAHCQPGPIVQANAPVTSSHPFLPHLALHHIANRQIQIQHTQRVVFRASPTLTLQHPSIDVIGMHVYITAV